MNKKVRDLWIQALKSGEFKQGRGRLKNASGNYCCLGVLCELHSRETGNTNFWQKDFNQLPAYDCASYCLPDSVKEWADLKQRNPKVRTDSVVKILKRSPIGDFQGLSYIDISTLNDTGVPFSEIAKVIEESF